MPRNLDPDAIVVIKTVKAFKRGGKERSHFALVPWRWGGEEVRAWPLGKPDENIRRTPNISTGMTYITVPREWADKVIKIALTKYEGKAKKVPVESNTNV